MVAVVRRRARSGDERSEEHCQREERYDPRAAKAFETCLWAGVEPSTIRAPGS